MTKHLITILLLVLLGNYSVAQSFDLSSDDFEVGEIYTAQPQILFSLAKWDIQPESYPLLDSIALFLMQHDELIVEIGTHTDSRGSDQCCMRLDTKRAESIYDYLVAKGVDASRLEPKGYGETQLLITDEEIDKMTTAMEKEEAHATNRRTEFKILAILE